MRSNSKILFIILIGLILRIISLDQSLWLDEATSVKAARLPIFDLITKFSAGDFHPPLYYILLKIWGSVFGWGEIQIRSLSIIFGLATIYFIYQIGRKLFNEKVAFWCSVFLSISPLFIFYSQEARMYSLETLLTTVVVYFFIKVVDEDNKKNWFWLIISTILLFYTDYLPIFLIFTLIIYLLIFYQDHFRKYKKEWFKSVFIVALISIIWTPIFVLQLKTAQQAKFNIPIWIEILGKTNLKELALIPVKFIVGRISLDNKILYGLVVFLCLIPFLMPLIKARRKLIWFWLLGPIILAAIFGFIFSGFSYFRLLFVLPAFYLLIAEGITKTGNEQIKKYILIGILLVSLTCSFAYLLIPKYHREDWKGAVSWIAQNNENGNAAAVFVANSLKDPYIYYSSGSIALGPLELNDNFYDKVYLMRYAQPILDPQDTLRKKIEILGYKKVQEKDFNGVVVWEYRK